MSKYNLVFCLFFAILASCATSLNPTPSDAYTKMIDDYSAGEVTYEGAYNNFKYRATILNSHVQNAYIDKKAEMYLWDPTKKQTELSKMQEGNATKTVVFLSFFTPLRQDDNLSTKKSIWGVYLQTSQGRYEGTIVKNRENRTELYTMFPYHQRYSTGYEVTFLVPLQTAENEETTMTIAGPLGNKSIKFPAKKY